ncbi:MAG TPA: RNA polymerase sigma factor, partial [Bacteroidota bacterium]|nr:RNA polymerase sigma factor [Bacteroidota bacterium]
HPEHPAARGAAGGEDPSRKTDDVRAHIERALHELPTLQRAVVILRHMDGLSTKQVSRILRCSEGTVKTHLFRGLKKLREKLEFLQEDLA